MTTNSVSKEQIAAKLEQFYDDLTPGRLELIDVDGLAFAVTEAVAALRTSPGGATSGEVVTAPAKPETGWLIYKAGRGWYRPEAQGYTNDPKQAGRYTHEEALSYSHPNGWSGPRDGITVRHESEFTQRINALAQPQETGSREAVAWLHNLTGVIRQDKPAASMGLHEDYTHLFTLSQLQAVEREREALIDANYRQAGCIQQCSAHLGPDASGTIAGLPLAVKAVVARAETAEASLAASIERAACEVDAAWRAKGGLNCTEVCAIIRSAALAGSNGE